MERAEFAVKIETVPDADGIDVPGHGRVRVTAEGMDALEFLLSPNPGEPLKPLAKIASGGELSRIMLALKAVGAGRGGVPTLVFDEIDTGISGQTAGRVAEKMARLAERHQILCITHLPQIAARAGTHLGVAKRPKGKRTVTEVARLDGPARVDALATLIGGESTAAARRHAEEMLGSR
jgi:DNA repair protein RecN (Recombination protein N)